MDAKWLPIESAPKDGTAFLAITSIDSSLYLFGIGSWPPDAGFLRAIDHEGDPMYPTHWMPLPEPPQEST